ncbi:hypothetical protein [uncultured Sphingomonas sp.]|uniref:hypothetical protein n=1 Tax=uncultured Sphingomonas sp. TaxID=158754 RepID=UPI00260B6262|nr:hypothetical protein [uncultured Sphingomonas sp.]
MRPAHIGERRVIVEGDTITVSDGDEIVAHVLWRHEYDHIYIESIKVVEGNQKALALMLARFRDKFRGNTVWFDALDCNEEMQRLVALLKAKPFNKTYAVVI